jgi:hypothetical protein
VAADQPIDEPYNCLFASEQTPILVVDLKHVHVKITDPRVALLSLNTGPDTHTPPVRIVPDTISVHRKLSQLTGGAPLIREGTG